MERGSAKQQHEQPAGCGPRFVAKARWLGFGLALLAGVVLHYEGSLLTLINQAAFVMLPVALGLRVWGWRKRRLETGLWRHPFRPELRRQLLQALNRCVFWLLLGWALTLSIPAVILAPDEYEVLLWVEWALVGTWALLEWLPGKPVYLAPNVLFAAGSVFLAVQISQILRPPERREAVVLSLPFEGEWNVFHGGRSALVNHHFLVPGQQHALDLDRSMAGPPTKDADRLESYPAWRQPLVAPADGKVVKVVDHLPDNPSGKTDTVNLVGNHVVLEIGSRQYALLAHLERGSAAVREGQRVKRGQRLARCGNSGNTSEPHLHFQVQDRPEFGPETRTYPILFRDVELLRAGRTVRGTEVDPRRNDRLRPANPPR